MADESKTGPLSAPQALPGEVWRGVVMYGARCHLSMQWAATAESLTTALSDALGIGP